MAAKEILEMIEAVDPKDTDALNDIDNMVEDYIYVAMGVCPPFKWPWQKSYKPEVEYTRSRNALKNIRPNGWEIELTTCGHSTDVNLWKSDDGISLIEVGSTDFPTEELSELHAIIQAVEWGRDNAP